MTTAAVNEDAVRTRAYLMWEADGRPFGRDDHYWGLAMAEMAMGATAAAGKPKRAAANSPIAEKTGKPKAAEKAAKAKKK